MGGNHWHGIDSLRTIVALGDSYSKSDDGKKTWVDHLQKRLNDMNQLPQIHNLASSGATAEDDLAHQVSHVVALFPKKETNASLHPDKTTYFVFMGINDCGVNDMDDLESIVKTVGDAVHDLYVQAGARNIVLIDILPIHRSPQAIDAEIPDEIEERVKTWNELLQAQITEFGISSKEATTLLFSSHQVLTDVLDDPSEYDFGEDDPETEGGRIWADYLHMTAEVHDILAERLLKSLTQ
ncbi:hypothetical protein GY45DRAFT_1326452 [Cubamyces sp. BRFM 1775]|nr:hypothetical protein GY45DRAFT_1326452 [Cubamyces sp. BRFM 1775]